jgi:hypothetical protein
MNCYHCKCSRFEATCTQYGHYINSIGGHSEDKETNNFWLIYTLSEPPDIAHPPSSSELSLAGVYANIGTTVQFRPDCSLQQRFPQSLLRQAMEPPGWGIKVTNYLSNSVAPEPEGSSPYLQEPTTGPYP